MNRLQVTTFCLITLITTTLVTTHVFADGSQWGDLRGQFIFDGPIPARESIAITKDTAVLGETIDDESLVVKPENRGLANVVIYLVPKTDADLRVHASYNRTAKAKVELAMQGGRFNPHILLLRTTQTLVQRNQDKIGHHANIQFVNNPPK